jgi:Mg-chelatase subunit ChlD
MTRVRWLVVVSLVSLVSGGCIVRGKGRAPRFTASGSLRVTTDAWVRISRPSGAISVTSKGAADLPVQMQQINEQALPAGEPVDLVYVVDTTGSMGDDIGAAKAQMRGILTELTARNPARRVGIVAYRDRGDVYTALVVTPLDANDDVIREGIEWLRVTGGGDLREHVYAGLDAALHKMEWRQGASRHIVLIGDAPPHEDYGDDPRNYERVMADAAALGVKIHTIGVHCDKACAEAFDAERIGAARTGGGR